MVQQHAYFFQHDPANRPTINEILKDDFMTIGYMPPRLPTSCLTMAPRFDTKPNASLIARRGPLLELNKDVRGEPGTPMKKEGNDGGVPKDCYLSGNISVMK